MKEKRRGEGRGEKEEKKGLRMLGGGAEVVKAEPGRVGVSTLGISKHFTHIPSLYQAR